MSSELELEDISEVFANRSIIEDDDDEDEKSLELELFILVRFHSISISINIFTRFSRQSGQFSYFFFLFFIILHSNLLSLSPPPVFIIHLFFSCVQKKLFCGNYITIKVILSRICIDSKREAIGEKFTRFYEIENVYF
jgi:hypothetical protein